ncbi:GNAT family N-acetyltransferase [Actinomadura nitritigenes]|uniref:GNAT family N-acetyltransferase n=1 Tax=Actinomadura nitritigenes TaxID=134602 RepID=UPI00368347FE
MVDPRRHAHPLSPFPTCADIPRGAGPNPPAPPPDPRTAGHAAGLLAAADDQVFAHLPYPRPWWGTGANAEAKRLMIAHAFDVLGFAKVAFRTDAAAGADDAPPVMGVSHDSQGSCGNQ